jgi:hypothetical protein
MQVNGGRCRVSAFEQKEKVEAALARLRSMKNQIYRLRLQCEALKQMESEKAEGLMCGECGEPIVSGEEVTLKGSSGEVKGYYHRDCFKAIWLSQSWTFDYSQPGFLRMSGKDK